MKIELRGVTKSYGSFQALNGVQLEILPGQIVAVVGANGAGKSSLLRCLAGIVGATKGKILYDGQEFHRERIDLRRRLMFLPDFPYMFVEKSVIDHIDMVLQVYEVDAPGIEDRVVSILRDFEMLPLAEQELNLLSRGQRYKAALTALLALSPELWLLDEPMASGMDPHGIGFFKTEVKAAAKRGCTVIYTTQILELAERFSDRVCVLHKGEVHAFDTMANLAAKGSGTDSPLHQIFDQLRGAAQ